MHLLLRRRLAADKMNSTTERHRGRIHRFASRVVLRFRRSATTRLGNKRGWVFAPCGWKTLDNDNGGRYRCKSRVDGSNSRIRRAKDMFSGEEYQSLSALPIDPRERRRLRLQSLLERGRKERHDIVPGCRAPRTAD